MDFVAIEETHSEAAPHAMDGQKQVHVKNTHPLLKKECDARHITSAEGLSTPQVSDDSLGLCSVGEFTVKQETDSVNVLEKQAGLSEDEEITFVCNICDVRFLKEENYRRHMEKHDMRRHRKHFLTLKCVECGKTFEKKLPPKEMLSDEDKKSQRCNVCEARMEWLIGEGIDVTKKSKQKQNLNTNPTAHEKPCKCSVCDEAFATGKELVKHIQVHKFDKKYACGVCESTFSESEFLAVHMAEHTGMKLYKCGICAKTFPKILLLLEHVKTRNAIKPHACVRDGIANIQNEKDVEKLETKVKELSKGKAVACGKNEKRIRQNNSGFGIKLEKVFRRDSFPRTVTVYCSQCGGEFEQDAGSTESADNEMKQKCNICEARDRFLSEETTEVKQESTVSEESTHSERFDMQNENQEFQQKTVTLECSLCECHFEQQGDETNSAISAVNKRSQTCNVCKAQDKWPEREKIHETTHKASRIEGQNEEQRFKCSVCRITFIAEHALRNHISAQHSTAEKRSFACDLCDKVYHEKGSLTRHVKRKHNEVGKPEIHKCAKCDRIFKTKTALVSHEKIHNDRSFVCEICDKTFPLQENLWSHYQISHAFEEDAEDRNQEIIKCKLCGKACTVESLKDHIITCLGIEIGLTSSNDVQIKQEKEEDHGEDDTGTYYACYTCGAMFTSEVSLNRHAMVKHGKSEKAGYVVINSDKKTDADKFIVYQRKRGPKPGFVVCKICHQGFRFDSALKRHIKEAHKSNAEEPPCKKVAPLTKTLECVGCQTDFEKEIQTGDEAQSVKDSQYCNICKARGKWLDKQYRSALDVNETDVQETTFKCIWCNKVFARNEDLQAHGKIHTTPYECTLCGKLFAREHLYHIHLRIHALEKGTTTKTHKDTEDKLKCTKCGMLFASCEFLENHVAEKHTDSNTNRSSDGKTETNERSPANIDLHLFRYKNCDELFGSSEGLQAHTSTEIGETRIKVEKEDGSDSEKPFMCKVCYEMFESDEALECHMVDHDVTFQDDSLRMKVEEDETNDEQFMTDEHECQLCKQMFETELDLINHMKIHNCRGIKSSLNKCTVVKRKMLSDDDDDDDNDDMSEHGTKDDKLYKCNICKQTFKNVIILTDHIHSHFQRNSFRPMAEKYEFKCETCGRRFTSETKLAKHHMKVHAGETN